MNIIFDINDYDKKNIFFLEAKQNIIMNGKFTKILYSNIDITTIGLFFKVHFNNSVIHNVNNKNILKFEKNEHNNKLIYMLSKLETDILDNYNNLYNCKKQFSTILSDFLMYGNIKLYMKERSDNNNLLYIIKISGVWENEREIGINYKFLEVNEIMK